VHHLRHLELVASNTLSIRRCWSQLYEESQILEQSRDIGDRFRTIRFARMYDQVQIDGFVVELKVYAECLGQLRLHQEAKPRQYSGA
jgi:hypothetical protein